MIKGFVLIFFARAAYRNVLMVSHKFDFAGEMHAIYEMTDDKGLCLM